MVTRVRISPFPLKLGIDNFMFKVYVLWSEKLQKRYIGSTSNVEERIKNHNNGNSKFTKGGIPWKLVYQESFSTVSEARKRELFLKSGQGRKFLDTILNEVKVV